MVAFTRCTSSSTTRLDGIEREIKASLNDGKKEPPVTKRLISCVSRVLFGGVSQELIRGV